MELKLMENYISEETIYKEAKEKVRNIRAFYLNLLCYCIVIPILIWINLTYSPEILWFFFSAAGWGIGLVFQGLHVFNNRTFFGANWERRKIREFMEKEKIKENSNTE